MDAVLMTSLRALAFGTPLLWAALGEIVAERSGVVNLGVEGMMVLGAFFAFATAQLTGSPALGLSVAALAGGTAALVHAVVCVRLRGNQYVSGLALGMVGMGIAGLLGRGWEGTPLRNPLPELSWITLSGLLLSGLVWVFLYHTRWGIALRSVGESPAAADVQGIPVFLVRYLAVGFGGLTAGIAGGFLSVAYRPSWTEGMTAGMGWIAIAITVFSGWDPLRAVAGSLLFGALFHLSFRLQGFIAPELLKMTPYLGTVLVLTLTMARRGSRVQEVPEALGVPYVRGER
ncbi:MAG: ABC transporter permease [Armatimonadota bacterium]|nr:ABC transporter permease [Armatimonadota bacterium]MDR7438474.1 ABC transporter permease [Armatimonadota bacterium]MDR7563171.1 ABC transporter permease [Armatimonadota bacterium]MDR7567162.1 ABC transporter permease [Armatimonadota bacterium]MDR7602314.1 ABC transporter permease [Armatimonadota bacterium]